MGFGLVAPAEKRRSSKPFMRMPLTKPSPAISPRVWRSDSAIIA